MNYWTTQACILKKKEVFGIIAYWLDSALTPIRQNFVISWYLIFKHINLTYFKKVRNMIESESESELFTGDTSPITFSRNFPFRNSWGVPKLSQVEFANLSKIFAQTFVTVVSWISQLSFFLKECCLPRRSLCCSWWVMILEPIIFKKSTMNVREAGKTLPTHPSYTGRGVGVGRIFAEDRPLEISSLSRDLWERCANAGPNSMASLLGLLDEALPVLKQISGVWLLLFSIQQYSFKRKLTLGAGPWLCSFYWTHQ